MKSSRAGPLFGFKPAGCRALGKGCRGKDPSKGGKLPSVPTLLPTLRKARRNSEKLASPDLALETTTEKEKSFLDNTNKVQKVQRIR